MLLAGIIRRLFVLVFNMSLSASFVILIIVTVRCLLLKAPKYISYLLWFIVLFRLLCPLSIESSVSALPKPEVQSVAETETQNENGLARYELQYVSDPTGGVESQYYIREDMNFFQVMIASFKGADTSRMFILNMLWLLGILVMLCYTGRSLVRCRRHLPKGRPVRGNQYDGGKNCYEETVVYTETGACQNNTNQNNADQNNADRYNVYEVEGLTMSFVYGVISPKIYIPAELSESEREYILMHEQMHIRRFDPLVKLLAYIALCIHWFNPLVWVFFFFMTRDMEMSCDEAVIHKLGEDVKQNYSASLLNMAVGRNVVRITPLSFGDGDVKGRIRNILKYKKPTVIMSAAAVLVLVIAMIVLVTNPRPKDTIEGLEDTVNTENEANSNVVEGLEGEATSADSQLVQEQVNKWATAFCGRDGTTIVSMTTEEVAVYLEEQALLNRFEDGTASFGWSSPWPRGKQSYHIQFLQDNTCQILYEASIADRAEMLVETLEFEVVDQQFTVTAESLTVEESIENLEEFSRSYPQEDLENTWMDYRSNGIGPILNENALETPASEWYAVLFQPDTAARSLLNLTSDTGSVTATVVETGENNTAIVEVYFKKDDGHLEVTMEQPYGGSGIWVPIAYRMK